MAKHTITLIPGDGIGIETSAAMQRVVEAAGADIEWEVAEAGAAVMEKTGGSPLPESTIEAVKRNKVAIKGPITTPVGTGFRSVNVALRKSLDLYVNLRPVLSIPGAGGRYEDVDLVIVRENSEDLYAGIEFEEGTPEAKRLIDFCAAEGAGVIRPDSGISIKPISITGSDRIVRFAFDYAEKHGREKVTAAHKANIMKFSDGLFLKEARKIAADYEGRIAFDDRIIDAFCMNLVTDPSQFDVILTGNLFGDILSDEASCITGSVGMLPSASLSDTKLGMYEPIHGSAPDIAGQNIANPIATILSAAMMLRYSFDLAEEADAIENAVASVLEAGHRTGDIAKAGEKKLTCTEMGDLICAAI